MNNNQLKLAKQLYSRVEGDRPPRGEHEGQRSLVHYRMRDESLKVLAGRTTPKTCEVKMNKHIIQLAEHVKSPDPRMAILGGEREGQRSLVPSLKEVHHD